jgi:hypothetical protein
MAKKKQPEPDNPEQSARFKEVAERILSEDADALFENAVNKMLKPKDPDQRKVETDMEP